MSTFPDVSESNTAAVLPHSMPENVVFTFRATDRGGATRNCKRTTASGGATGKRGPTGNKLLFDISVSSILKCHDFLVEVAARN